MSDSTKYVWIPDKENLFTKGLIVGEEGNKLMVRSPGSSEVLEFDADSTEKVNPEQFDKVGDMAELTYLNEPSVINNMSMRWKDGRIYTYSGLFLVAVNPYKDLPIYDDNVIQSFKDKRRDESEPHIYAVAQQAISNLRESKRDQSILITGESGAGKTENTKKAIQYLSSITNSLSTGIDKRILQTNPILESFGNAQTIRNTNSSRFGKFIKIHFDLATKGISGASIQWYLLEKSRVVTQHSNERNYHVFYQLLRGAPESTKLQLEIPNDATPKSFNFLASGASEIPGVNDSEEYGKLVQAFEIMGFTEREVSSIMVIIASILHLGQIKYRPSSADQGSVADMADVDRACRLLGIDSNEFVSAVLKPKVKTGREYISQSRTADQAFHTTNAIAKALYERLFGYIVSQLNLRLGEQTSTTGNIGVLDIAGFEIFEQNSFEQLCINYTNEKLQQFFNHHMFVLEQEEYLKQKVDWEYIDYGADLQPTINLIEQSISPMGIFSCLNEESTLLSGSDASFNEKLAKQWLGKNDKFTPSRLGSGFTIQHYAQTVEYQTDGWMEKNKDPLSDAAETMLSGSSNDLVQQLFPSLDLSSKSKAGKSSLTRTVAQRHKEQLNSLMLHLEATHPHFVRCILPNTKKSDAIFDNRLVLEQLRYNGVLEGIRIARSGFPNRIEFLEFNSRYRALVDSVSGPLNSQHTCVTILQRIKLDPALYKVGLSKVFFRNGVLADLENRLDSVIKQQVLAVQSLARGSLVRTAFSQAMHRRRAAKLLAKGFRANIRNSTNPWWQVAAALKPLLVSKEGMDSSRKDIRMQKLESTVNRLKEEQVELVSSRNELRGELISALRSKEELLEDITNLQKEQKETNDAYELAVTAARSRDEASTAALNQLSQQHAKLRDSFDELTTLKSSIEAGFEEKLKQERLNFDNNIKKLTSEQSDSVRAVENLLEEAKNEIDTHKKTILDLRESLKRHEEENKRMVEELSCLKNQLTSAKETTIALQKTEAEFADFKKSSESDKSKTLDEMNSLKTKLEEVQVTCASLTESSIEVVELKKHLQATEELNKSLNIEQEKLLESQGLSVKEVEKLTTSISEKSAAFTALEDEHRKLTENHRITTTESQNLTKELDEKTKQLDSTTTEVTKLRDWLSKAKGEIKTAVTTAKELTTLKAAHALNLDKLQNAEADLVKHKSEISELKEKINDSVSSKELSEANKELSQAGTQLKEAENQLNLIKINLQTAETALKNKSEELSETKQLLENAKEAQKDTTAKLELSAAEVSSLNNKLLETVSIKLHEEVKSQLETATSEIEALKAQLKTQVQRDQYDKANSELSSAQSEISKLKQELSSSVHADKLESATTQLESAKAKITLLEEQASKLVSADDLKAAKDRTKRLEADLDLANENLIKINEELSVSQTKLSSSQKKYDTLAVTSSKAKTDYEKALSDATAFSAESEKIKQSLNKASRSNELLTRDMSTLREKSDSMTKDLRLAEQRIKTLEKEAAQKQRELSFKQQEVDDLSNFKAQYASSQASTQQEIDNLRGQLEIAKKSLVMAQTQVTPAPGLSPKLNRFPSHDTEQQLADSNHNVAELQARVDELQRDLESSREITAKHAIVQQKYEQLLHVKKDLVQQINHLTLGRKLQSRESTITQAQDSHMKKMTSEIRILGLQIAQKDRRIQQLESEANSAPTHPQGDSEKEIVSLRKSLKLADLRYVQLEKQMKALKNSASSDNADQNDSLHFSKVRGQPLQNISNDRRVSEHHYFGDDKETTDIYRDRANEYLGKLEKAEIIIGNAVRAKNEANKEIEILKSRLEGIDDDEMEFSKLKSQVQLAAGEIDKRDILIKDLRKKALISAELDRDLKHSTLKLKELSAERKRLSSEKSRLETRLHDMLASHETSIKNKDDQILAFKQAEKQMQQENVSLRWKIERKDRRIDQLLHSLTDADVRADRLKSEIEMLRTKDDENIVKIRQITRQVSEAKERYLTAERDLESSRLSRSSGRTPRDHDLPAFI